MNKDYCVYYAITKDYWKHLFVSINTLKKFNKIETFVFHDGLKQEIKNIFFNYLGPNSVKFIRVNRIPINNFGYFIKILAITKLSDYKKILYLDSDTVISKSISNIFRINLKNNIVAGVSEPFETKNMNLDLIQKKRRLNTGVMLINTKKWIKFKTNDKIFNKFQKIENKNSVTDQPIINYILYGKIKFIKKNWNFLDNHFHKSFNQKKINIVHFNRKKPWLLNTKNSFKNIYIENRRLIDKFFVAEDVFSLKELLKFIFHKTKII